MEVLISLSDSVLYCWILSVSFSIVVSHLIFLVFLDLEPLVSSSGGMKSTLVLFFDGFLVNCTSKKMNPLFLLNITSISN